jgi:pimeloyl-ACP methyl ester carboxylesterase
LSPLFAVGSLRMCPEIVAAKGLLPGAAFTASRVANVLVHMFSPRLMARRARLIAALDVEIELRRVQRPTLVVTGEPRLDRVVPVGLTRDYLRIWPHATVAVLARTGHLGPITRPDEFASLVVPFAERASRDHEDEKRRTSEPNADGRVCKARPALRDVRRVYEPRL